jgi:hypothetical protein
VRFPVGAGMFVFTRLSADLLCASPSLHRIPAIKLPEHESICCLFIDVISNSIYVTPNEKSINNKLKMMWKQAAVVQFKI